MVRRIIAVLLAVGIMGSCSGCLQKKNSVRLVNQISAQWDENGTDICHVFEKPEKLQLILSKVRTLGQRFASDTDPETLRSSAVTMTISYSDGTQKQYQIKPDRYVRVGDASWQQADPKQVTALRLLLLSLPGDSRA